ncbi:MAG TPA: hypothetical protein VKS79_01315, partial [Gemmataceae bacterium]|nr:hypothetical protein [Gemmataceae bacterium]
WGGEKYKLDQGSSPYRLHPNGKTLIVGTNKGEVRLMDRTAKGFVERTRFKVGDDSIGMLEISPDGRLLAVQIGMFRKVTTALWDLTGPKPMLRETLPQEAQFADMSFSPDSKRLALACTDQTTVWDVQQQPAKKLFEGEHFANGVNFSPDGRTLATATTYGQLTLRDAETGAMQKEWHFPGMIKWVTYAPDGRHLVTINGNGTAYVLRLSPLAQTEKPASPEASPDRQIAEWVIKKGGAVNLGGADVSKLPLPAGDLPIQRINFSQNAGIVDADLRTLTVLEKPFVLDLYGCKNISDSGIRNLAGCKGLSGLNIRLTAATPGCIDAIAAHAALETLFCPDGMTDADLAKLAGLKKLAFLAAGNSAITDDGVETLTHLPELVSLQLHFPKKLTDRGALALAKMKQLQNIELKGTAITDKGWQELAKLPKLQLVMFTDSAYTEAMLKALAGNHTLIRIWGWDDGSHLQLFKNHPSLHVLILTDPKVDDKSVETVVTMKKLEYLNIKGSRITAAGFEKLKVALSQCIIDSDFGRYEPPKK